jgi:hypothetical protein
MRLLLAALSLTLAGAIAQVAVGAVRPADALIACGLAAAWAWFWSSLSWIIRECVRLAVTGE